MIYREPLALPDAWDGKVWRVIQPALAAGPHVHDELELNLITRGHCRYLVNGTRLDMAPHQLLWLFPDEPHVLVSTSSDFQMWIGVFRVQRWAALLQSEKYAPLLQRCPAAAHIRSLLPPQAKRLESLCEGMVAHENDLPLLQLGLRYLLLQAWTHFLSASSGLTNAIHPAVFKASVLLQEKADRCTIDQVAAAVGLSTSRLSVLFSQQVGLSITDYRNQQCLRRFQLLLASGRFRNLTDLALEAGFGSYAQFSRIYKAAVGAKPRELLGHKQ